MAEDNKCPDDDVLHLGPDLGNGTHPFVRHRPDHSIEAGLARPFKDGEPLNFCGDGAAVHLSHRGPGAVYDVEDLYTPEKSEAKSGPSMVNSSEFRDGWDRIFGKQAVGEA